MGVLWGALWRDVYKRQHITQPDGTRIMGLTEAGQVIRGGMNSHGLGSVDVYKRQVFTIPGLGQLMINAIRQKDTPIVMGAVMTTAIFASLINLLVDIVYTYIDPRLASQFTSVKRSVKKA